MFKLYFLSAWMLGDYHHYCDYHSLGSCCCWCVCVLGFFFFFGCTVVPSDCMMAFYALPRPPSITLILDAGVCVCVYTLFYIGIPLWSFTSRDTLMQNLYLGEADQNKREEHMQKKGGGMCVSSICWQLDTRPVLLKMKDHAHTHTHTLVHTHTYICIKKTAIIRSWIHFSQ